MTRLLTFVFLAGLAAGSALAQPPPPRAAPAALPNPYNPDQRFAAADANKDGRVDRDEFIATLNPDARAFIDAIWRDRDRNGDGWLSKEELTANTPAGANRLRPAAASQ